MKRLSQLTVVVGLLVILAMLVGGIVALRNMPTPKLPGLEGVEPSPPTLDDAEALAAELSALREEQDRLEPVSKTRLAVGLDETPADHMVDAMLSRILGELAVKRMRLFIEREDLDEAATQRFTAQMMISATRAHLELARLKAGE